MSDNALARVGNLFQSIAALDVQIRDLRKIKDLSERKKARIKLKRAYFSAVKDYTFFIIPSIHNDVMGNDPMNIIYGHCLKGPFAKEALKAALDEYSALDDSPYNVVDLVMTRAVHQRLLRRWVRSLKGYAVLRITAAGSSIIGKGIRYIHLWVVDRTTSVYQWIKAQWAACKASFVRIREEAKLNRPNLVVA